MSSTTADAKGRRPVRRGALIPRANGPFPGAVPSRRPGSRKQRRRQALQGWGFVAPAMLIVLGLSIFPAAWAFLLSLQSWDGFSEPTQVGLQNYRTMVTDSALHDAVGHTALYTLLFVPASVLLGMGLAILLNRTLPLMGAYRTAIFLPFVASAAATGILTTYLFNPQFGLANTVLRALHLPQQGWLENPSQAMLVITLMSLWGQAAFTTVIYLAALQDIPNELLEATRIDGANRWQSFWHVTFPHLAPVTVFVTVWQFIEAVQLFDLVYTTTRGGPLNATQTIVYYLWETAFKKLEFGYASAIAYGLFAVTLVITAGVVLYSRRTKTEMF